MPITGVGVSAAVAGGHEYVNRGDPTDYDFDESDLIKDDGWYALDLSSVVTDIDAVLVHLYISYKDASTGKWVQFRRAGNANVYNVLWGYTLVANLWMSLNGLVAYHPNQEIEYSVSTGMDNVNIVVRGWWKPA